MAKTRGQYPKITDHHGVRHIEGATGLQVLFVPCLCGEDMMPPKHMDYDRVYKVRCLNGHVWQMVRSRTTFTAQPLWPDLHELEQLYPKKRDD